VSEWRALVRRRLGDRAPAAVVDEIAEHIEDVYRAALAAGQSDTDAARAAERELEKSESLERFLERRARGSTTRGRWWTGLGGDLRQGLRVVRARPTTTSVALATLAIGIGACTAMFSVFNSVVLHPLPYPNSDRLVLLWESHASDPNADASTFIVAAPNYLDWRARAKSFESTGIWEYLTFNVAGTDEPVQVNGVRASSSLFDVLGIRPARGRAFTSEEDTPGHHVAVISDRLWRLSFGTDPGIVGRIVRLNDAPYEVIGVMPPSFAFPAERTAVWIPIALNPGDRDRGGHSFFVAARLAPGVALAQAQGEMNRIGAQLAEQYPVDNHGESATVQMMAAFGISTLHRLLTMLLGAVGLVLLIACVNVANLQIGVGLGRRREFVVRTALGAGFGRIVRQLAAESLVLGALGGVGGVALAWLATHATTWIFTAGLLARPFRATAASTVDGRALLVAAGASLFAALTFGLAPLAMLKRTAPQGYLRDGDRGATRTSIGVRRVFVTAEVALAVILVSGAGLLIVSLSRLLHVDPGLDPREVGVVSVSLPQVDPYGPAERTSFCASMARGLAETQLFQVSGATSHLPLDGGNASRAFAIEGRPTPAPGAGAAANYRVTCPGYFQTLGIPLPTGRDFTPEDRRDATPVAIVNQATADKYWPNHDAVGQRIRIGSAAPWSTIVGVAGNVHHFDLDDTPQREIYVPYGQAAWPEMTVLAKARGPLTATAEHALQAAIRAVDPSLPTSTPRTMQGVISGSVSWRQPFVRLLTGFAGLGLVLAAIGIYGVLGFYVAQRTRELGIRAALGATRPALTQLVLRQSLAPTLAGLLIGLAGSRLASQLLQAALFGVRPGDPLVGAAVASLFLLVSLASSWAPAHRAATIDPAVALRAE
jgi:putative ABC transport system permease protein